MNKIEAIIRPERVSLVTEALAEAGFIGLNVVHVTGRGVQRGIQHVGRGGMNVTVDMLPKTKLEVVSKDADVDKVVEAERRSRETNLQSNPYWAFQLTGAKASGQDPRFLLDTSTFDAVSRGSIQEDAQLYLNEARVVIVTLLPVVKIGRP